MNISVIRPRCVPRASRLLRGIRFLRVGLSLVAFDVDEVVVASEFILPNLVPLFLEECLPLVERLRLWVGAGLNV